VKVLLAAVEDLFYDHCHFTLFFAVRQVLRKNRWGKRRWGKRRRRKLKVLLMDTI